MAISTYSIVTVAKDSGKYSYAYSLTILLYPINIYVKINLFYNINNKNHFSIKIHILIYILHSNFFFNFLLSI